MNLSSTSDISRIFRGIPNSVGGLGVAVMPPETPRIYCSKMVKICMKCMLDNLKVIVAMRLKINLTSSFNTKSSLIWSFELSCTVLKLFKQYDWVIWLISVNILKCKFWDVSPLLIENSVIVIFYMIFLMSSVVIINY